MILSNVGFFGLLAMGVIGSIALSQPRALDVSSNGAITLSVVGFLVAAMAAMVLDRKEFVEIFAFFIYCALFLVAMIGSVGLARPGVLELSHSKSLILTVVGWILFVISGFLKMMGQTTKFVLGTLLSCSLLTLALIGSIALGQPHTVDISVGQAIALTVVGWFFFLFFVAAALMEKFHFFIFFGLLLVAMIGSIGLVRPGTLELSHSTCLILTIMGWILIGVASFQRKMQDGDPKQILAAVVLCGLFALALIGSIALGQPQSVDLSRNGALVMTILGWSLWSLGLGYVFSK